MGLNQVTYVTDILSLSNQLDSLRVKRMLEAGEAEIEVATPVVLTILKNANEPRLPSLSARIRSLEMPMVSIGASDLGLEHSEVGLDGSPTRVVTIRIPESNRNKTVYKGVHQEALDQVAEWVVASS
jgi:electron transfer flavoprotein beta subunit